VAGHLFHGNAGVAVLSDVAIEWAAPGDAGELADVLAPAFEDYVNVVIGDMDRAKRVIPKIIRSMDGIMYKAVADGRAVGAIIVTLDRPKFLARNALSMLATLGLRRAMRANAIAKDYMRSEPERRRDEAWIEAVGVLDDSRRKGIGSRLIEMASDEVRKRGKTALSLAVKRDSPAVAFYEALGFVKAGEFDNRLGGWYRMRLELE